MRNRLFSCFVVAVMASAVASGAGLNAPVSGGDAPLATGSITNLSGITDCFESNSVTFTIHVVGITDDGSGNDEVKVQIWDDGVLKVEDTYSVAVGSETDITDTLNWSGPIGQGALGVGVLLLDIPGDGLLDVVDPFELEGEDGCGDPTPTFTPSPPPEPVPATGTTGLLAMIVLLAAVGAFLLMRQRS